MATKRKVNNLLALAVLSVIVERPMHRYEIATALKDRGKDRDMDIKWGSLYTVVQNMAKANFLEIIGSERDGARPERTIYRITDAGRAELLDWTRELIAVPESEHHRFVAGLSILGVIPPDEVIELLGKRVEALRHSIEAVHRELADIAESGLPRLFIIETEYGMAMLEAEMAWANSLRAELVDGTFPMLDEWRRFHADHLSPSEVTALVERGMVEKRSS
ncbi:PadR family transcriptional regulator [Nocardia sp. NPDC052566]|uniref:PadR family transcriptional regulator n=1 Tax=Nocardia sp. NPDC052566 TaxID=3364330 RepID=UPI0037C6BDE5